MLRLLNPISSSIGGWGFFHDFRELAGEVALVSEATFVADFGKAFGGLNNLVTGLLDT